MAKSIIPSCCIGCIYGKGCKTRNEILAFDEIVITMLKGYNLPDIRINASCSKYKTKDISKYGKVYTC